jgi:hypothetical protein
MTNGMTLTYFNLGTNSLNCSTKIWCNNFSAMDSFLMMVTYGRIM